MGRGRKAGRDRVRVRFALQSFGHAECGASEELRGRHPIGRCHTADRAGRGDLHSIRDRKRRRSANRVVRSALGSCPEILTLAPSPPTIPAGCAPGRTGEQEEKMAAYDAIIIGTGQAGPALARKMAGLGMKVAIAERGAFGATCCNTGCTPTKRLMARVSA